MEAVDNQGWIIFYNRLKDDFQAKKRFAATISNVDQKDMLGRIDQLEKHLSVMKDAPMEYDISISEIGRRQFITESLKKQINAAAMGTGSSLFQIPSGTSANSSVDIRNSASSIPRTSQTAGGGTIHNTSNSAPATLNPLTTSDRALIQRQQEIIKMQDNVLSDIEKGVDRLQIQAKEIGNEAKVHTKILEELDTHVEDATDKLKQETKHAETVKRYTNDCKAYMCIVLEIIILLVLILVFFVHI